MHAMPTTLSDPGSLFLIPDDTRQGDITATAAPHLRSVRPPALSARPTDTTPDAPPPPAPLLTSRLSIPQPTGTLTYTHRAYPKQGLVGVQTVAKFRSSDAPLLPVRVYLANIRCVKCFRGMGACMDGWEGEDVRYTYTHNTPQPPTPINIHRLEQVGTDLLLTLNLPPSAQGPPPPPPAASEAEEMGPQVFSKVRQKEKERCEFNIVDRSIQSHHPKTHLRPDFHYIWHVHACACYRTAPGPTP